MKKTILYIHGMGGGSDSRIPSILGESLDSVSVVCRTYSFDPEEAHRQIFFWVDDLKPDIVIGESLGALHALRLNSIPCILVSPALNAPLYFELLSWLTLIPGVTGIFDKIYKPREGDRQSLHFTFTVLRKYYAHRKSAIEASKVSMAEGRVVHAFFGSRDHYRRSGIVSVKTWKKLFGDRFTSYDGTHYMEVEYINSLLLPLIRDMLKIK